MPSELEGIAYIQVTIQRDNEQLVSATLGQFSGVPQKGAELHWQNKLEAGQRVFDELKLNNVAFRRQIIATQTQSIKT